MMCKEIPETITKMMVNTIPEVKPVALNAKAKPKTPLIFLLKNKVYLLQDNQVSSS
jgi:hypothetical protein